MSQSAVDYEKTNAHFISRLAILAVTMSEREFGQTEHIPAFGGRTACELVSAGRAEDVDLYIDHLELGGFA